MNSAVHDPHEQPASKAGDTGQLEFPDLNSVRIALDAGRIGVWSWDIKSNTVQWSGNLERHPRSARRQLRRHIRGFQKDIHPEDQPEVMAAIQESLRSGKPYHVHYRLAPRCRRGGALGRGDGLRGAARTASRCGCSASAAT